MRLVKLAVERFGCIEKASIDFGPGLNVLHGPNDLGKSSLVDAIRLALLVPFTSTAFEPFVSWTNSEPPKIVLVLQKETKFWRITKSYKQAAGLESSRDGANFSLEHSARKVDEEIRKLLEWGILPPGGKNAPRGLPASFLTTVLLARQGDVDEILTKSLAGDDEGSGKQRISKALQAVVQDPLFKKALAAAQSKVDEAYQADGKWSRRKDAPIRLMQERIKSLQADVDAKKKDVHDAEIVRDQIREFREQRASKEIHRDDCLSALRELEQLLNAATIFEERKTRFDAIVVELKRIDDALAEVATLEQSLKSKQDELGQCEEQATTQGKKLVDSEAAFETARTTLADMASQDRANRVAARRNEILSKKLEVETEGAGLREKKARAEEAEKLHDLIVELEKGAQAASATIQALRVDLSESGSREKEALAALDEVKGIRLYAALRDAEAALTAVELKAASTAKLRASAETKSAQAKAARTELASLRVPSAQELRGLQKLRDDLRVAEAQLNVGLAVEVRSLGADTVAIAKDGEDLRAEQLAKRIDVSAERTVRLVFASVAEILVSGGGQTYRDEARRLRARWDEQAVPTLRAAGVTEFNELQALVDKAETLSREAQRLEQDVESLGTQGAAMGDVDALLAEARGRVENATAALARRDREQLADRSIRLKGSVQQELEKLELKAEQMLDRARSDQRRINLDIEKGRLKEETSRTELARHRQSLAEIEVELGGPWRSILDETTSRLLSCSEGLRAIGDELEVLERTTESSQAAARTAISTAETALRQAKESVTLAQKARDESLKGVAALQAQLELRKQDCAKLDRSLVEQAVARSKANLESTPKPSRPITLSEIEGAKKKLQDAEQAVREAESECHKAEGALTRVGGLVADEQLTLAEQALSVAQVRQREVEEEFQAWRLLLDTLREAETAQSNHLGNTLVEPVAKRFAELTNGRYAGLQLGTELSTDGVIAAGSSRSPQALSVGTKEQLATLLRLSLAEQLGTVLVLDDQLVQSDPQRMRWFATLLRDAAESIQIIALTCRPKDYLWDEDLNAGESVPGYKVRGIDLDRVMARAPETDSTVAPINAK